MPPPPGPHIGNAASPAAQEKRDRVVDDSWEEPAERIKRRDKESNDEPKPTYMDVAREGKHVGDRYGQ